MQATLSAKGLRSVLPRGQTLPDDVFARRHAWMQRILWLHVVGIPVFGLFQGFSLGHCLIDATPLLTIALLVRRIHNRRGAASMMALGLLTSSALLVHLWHGAIEAHFHFFVMIPLLALYEDWIPFMLAVAYVGIHHGLMGVISPGSVYNHGDAIRHPWKWAAIHGLFVAAAGAVSIVQWRLNEDVRDQTRIESRRRAEAEAVAATLQRGLRPERLPVLEHGAVAARYLPADTRDIGGDWYDVLQLADGRVALTLGDVAGHGVLAASQMAALRHAVRAYAQEGLAPGQVARLIDRFFQGEFATFVFMVFEPRTGELRFANAGHLQPLMISPDSGARYLAQSASLPLGLEQGASFEEQCVRFPPGATVLAYTDGLVERRGKRIDEQLARLKDAVSGAGLGAEIACERALAAFPPDGSDDVALLAFQATPAPQEAFEVEPHPAALAAARTLVREWLGSIGAEQAAASDLVLATDEALTNAVAHSGTQRNVEVQLALLDGSARVRVRDFGNWAASTSDSDHGRGLMLMDALTNRLDVDTTPSGTTVTLMRRVLAAHAAEDRRRTPPAAVTNGDARRHSRQALR